jgi:hypothetical protein
LPLSRDTRLLARLAARNDRDGSLKQMLSLAEAGVRGQITVLLDSGHMVTGDLATDVDWGEHLDRVCDDAFAEAAERARAEGDDETAERWSRWRDIPESRVGFARQIADRNAQRESVQRETEDTPTTRFGKTDWSQIEDDELAELVIAHVERPRLLTLANAAIAPPGGSFDAVPDPGLIRVETAHIAAWYPGRSSTVSA